MLDLGLIEPVDKPLCGAVVSPVIIQKQGDKRRMCSDFRAPENYTVSEIYTIPCVNIVIQTLLGRS